MLIAKERRKENIAEYLLYMWHVEDLTRLFEFDLNKIDQSIIQQYDQPEKVREEIRDWYKQIIYSLKEEGKEKNGHVSFVQSVMDELNEIHVQLLDTGDPKYSELYKSAAPNIISLRNKMENKTLNDIEVCLNGLYGLMLLRLKKQEITGETLEGMATISRLMAYLSKTFKEQEEKNNKGKKD
ncbi:MAG: DUF4924 family protein [bacterium]